MPVLAKYCGIVVRVLIDRTFGTHVHAFYGDDELVIGLNPPRVIQGEAPGWVRDWALSWTGLRERELLYAGGMDLAASTPLNRQAAARVVCAI